MAYLRALVRFLYGVPTLVLVTVGIVLLSWIPIRLRGVRLASWFFTWGVRIVMPALGLRFICEDSQAIVQHRGLILSNHVSFFDTLVMSHILPMRYVSKAEVRKWPFIGQIAAATGTMFVDRSDKSKRADVRQQVMGGLRSSQYPPIVIFPEGKRNPEDTLLPFRYGVFEIAVETGVPYLLCAIHYEDTESMTWQSHKESLTTSIQRIVLRNPSRVWLLPLKIVQPQPGDDPQALAAEAREIVGEALREMRSGRQR
jgi:1-acyl-sn-glycerol-3-phosphate acyltransferase